MNNQFIHKFRKELRKLERALFFQKTESCCEGISMAQCHTLLEIEGKKKTGITELANSLLLDKSTVSRTVDGLARNGLIERIIPSEDRRSTELSLSSSGLRTCRDINSNNDAYMQKSLSALTSEEQEELLRLLTKLAEGMLQQIET